MSSRTKQAGLLSATELARFGVKTIIGIILARNLSQADFGSYRQLFLIYGTFSTFLLLGLPQSLLYFLPKADNPREQKQIISRTINILSLLAIVFSLVLFVLRANIAAMFNNAGLEKLLLIYCLYPIFMFINQLYSTIMLGLQKPLKAAEFTVFSITADFLLILGAILLSGSLSTIVAAILVSAFLQWGFVHYKLKNVTEFFVFDTNGLRAQLKYAIPLGLSSMVGILTVQLDKLVVSGCFSPEQFAVFSIGAMELPVIGILANSVNSIILPAMSSMENRSAATAIYKASVRKNALIVFPIVAFCFVMGSQIISLVYGTAYIQSVPYFRIYLFSLPLRIASYGILFQAFNQTKTILYSSIAALILNLGLNIILVKSLGMMGPALATVLVVFGVTSMYLILIPIQLKINLKHLFPGFALIKTAFAVILSGFIVHYTLSCVPTVEWQLAVGFTLFSALYLFIAIVIKVIHPYDIDTLFQFTKSFWQRNKKHIV